MIHTEVRIVEKNDPPPYPELAGKTIHHCKLDRVTVLQGGMESGHASVAILADLPDGSIAFIETSARIFEGIAGAVRGACQRWGEDNT